MFVRYVVGYVLFWGPIAGALAGLAADTYPWWSWVFIAMLIFFVVSALTGRIRNGYWGASPSTSAWEQIRAEEEARRHDRRA